MGCGQQGRWRGGGGNLVLGTHSAPLNCKKVGKSPGLSIPALYNGFKGTEREAGRKVLGSAHPFSGAQILLP